MEVLILMVLWLMIVILGMMAIHYRQVRVKERARRKMLRQTMRGSTTGNP